MKLTSTFSGVLSNLLKLKHWPSWLRKSMWGVIPAMGVLSFYAVSQTAAPLAINLSAEPLYAKGLGAKPTLTLALSVEFPTVGAQYVNTPGATIDASYAQATEYLGYYDADSCYTYNNAPAATPGYTTADLKRFDRSSAAVNHGCGGNGFSGNFMNWATSSAIDVLRLGLTGGDRIVDTADLTVVQRAVLRTGAMYNDGNFPAKQLSAALALQAVPNNLRGTHNGDIWVANCLNRVHFGTANVGNCGAPGNNSSLGATSGSRLASSAILSSDGFFYSRVQVCDSSGGVLQDTRKYNSENYCVKYPNGNYKPTGNLQKYSDRLRVAAFGYLMDNTLARYGGVLRAPMKYVGPKSFDSNGGAIAGTNPVVEWDATTGVFKDNPEAIAGANAKSGVINYLNQFGRTGGVAGTYKTYDPVTELYYEAVRYIQGLNATPQATAGITAALTDGYPVYDNSGSALTLPRTDPHAGGSSTKDYACVKNNIVVVGDVNTHADKSVPGNTLTTSSDFTRAASLANNEPNFRDWTNVVGGFEKKTSVTYLDSSGVSRNTNVPNTNAVNPSGNYPNLQDAVPGCCNNNAYLMSGIAYWANTHDIRGTSWTNNTSAQRQGMRITTYVMDVNENGSQTNVTTRRNNQFYLAGKYGGFKDKSGGKGNPFVDTAGVTDNTGWETSAGSNLAKNYFLSSSAADVLKSLRDMFESIAQEGNGIAGASVSSTKPIVGGAAQYSSKFEPGDWSGKVTATPLGITAGAIDVATATPLWEASDVLKTKALNATYISTTRNIVAGRSAGNTSGAAAMTFKWADVNSDTDTTMKQALDKATPAGVADGKAQERLDYLRGDKSKEGSPYRTRSSLLGDIVNSPVVYSKNFNNDINTSDYKTFLTTNAGRPGAVFVGANDGMLHAFNTQDGSELFAYIPSWLADKLPALTNPSYNSSLHQSYVDGPTVVGEALVGTDWKTVLVSSTGGGGQGVFALDVSNPGTFAKNNVMWEFTDRDDADLGNVMGKAQIVKIRTNKKSAAVATYEWFAVVASGVNNFVNDGAGRVSTSGKPALFLLSLNKPAGAAWSLGSNYYKIIIENSATFATLSTTVSPGLINFETVWSLGSSRKLDLVYMGDLHGNLWKLDFDTASTTLDLAAVTLANLTAGTSYKPLFQAKDAAGNVQPISVAPQLRAGEDNNLIVMFGTGKYLESSDNNLTPVRVQSFYALNDVGVNATIKTIVDRDRLQQGTITSGAVSVPPFIWGRAATATDATQRSGFYFNFAVGGERQIGDAETIGNKIAFGSIIPPQNLTDPCGGGSSNIYTINFFTGAGTVDPSGVGLIGSLIALETTNSNSATAITISDSAGQRKKTITRRLLVQGTGGSVGTTTNEIETVDLGRLSWRQINNYQELKNRTWN